MIKRKSAFRPKMRRVVKVTADLRLRAKTKRVMEKKRRKLRKKPRVMHLLKSLMKSSRKQGSLVKSSVTTRLALTSVLSSNWTKVYLAS